MTPRIPISLGHYVSLEQDPFVISDCLNPKRLNFSRNKNYHKRTLGMQETLPRH